MNRMWVVARQEFLAQVRRRSFLFMVFVFPLLVGGMGVLTGYMGAQQAEKTDTLGQIGVVDHSGVLAAERERPEGYVTFATDEEAAEALQSGEIGAYFVVAPDYMTSGAVQAYSTEPVGVGIESQLRDYLVANLLADRTPEETSLVRDPAEIAMATLDGRLNVEEEMGIFMILAPVLFAMVFVMSISMTSSTLMQTVVEEKETRMVEILVTTITPLQLLTGKILALFALGIVQVVVWVVAAALALTLRPGTAEMLSGMRYPAWLLVVGIVYLFLGYLLYGTLLAGIGASSSSMQEAQPLAGVFSLLAVAPIFLLMQFMENPNGSVATILSLVPFSAPTSMMIRLVMGEVPLWQIGLSLALLAATVALVMWLSAWVFRVGLLMTGKRLTPRGLMEAMRGGPAQAVTAGRMQ